MSIPNTFLLYSCSFLSSYPGSATTYKADGKENTDEEDEDEDEDEWDVKEIYILLSGILVAVVTSSAVRGIQNLLL